MTETWLDDYYINDIYGDEEDEMKAVSVPEPQPEPEPTQEEIEAEILRSALFTMNKEFCRCSVCGKEFVNDRNMMANILTHYDGHLLRE